MTQNKNPDFHKPGSLSLVAKLTTCIVSHCKYIIVENKYKIFLLVFITKVGRIWIYVEDGYMR